MTGSSASSRVIIARAMSAALPRSRKRKNAHEPSRKRSTRPASARRRRWRDSRGWDWRKISVRSETVSSASAISAKMRNRVASPAALSMVVRAGKARGSVSMGVASIRYKDIFMRLSAHWQGPGGTNPKINGTSPLPRQKQIDFFEEALHPGVLPQQDMVIALERHEPGARNSGRHLTSSLQWNLGIAARVHHQSRHPHLRKEPGHVELRSRFEIPRRTFRRRCLPLQLIE